ncbi:MAG: hypothetical protein JXQ99_27015 [Hyphomicrobiaceae bacterium]
MPIEVQSPNPTPQSEFISNLYIQHGPRELLGRYFLQANKALTDRGIFLETGTFADLLRVNEANRDSWLPLFPALNPQFCQLDEDNSFCIVGRDADGEIVATQAGRLFDWQNSSFAEAAVNMTLLYDDPSQSANPNETWTVSAPMASELRGKIAFTGAVWYHPKVRGRGLASLIPRLARALSLTQWNVDATVVMMSKNTHSQGLFKKTGHVNFQDGVHARASTHGDVDYLLFWMRQTDIIREIGNFLAAEGDGRAVPDGNAEKSSIG